MERLYSVRPDYKSGHWAVDIDDLMTVEDLAVLVDGVAVTGGLEPRNAAADGRPWTRLIVDVSSPCEVSVTARWGWTAVPLAVEEACLLQASRFNARRESPFGVAGSPDVGSELRLMAKVDPDVAVVLRSYWRMRAVA